MRRQKFVYATCAVRNCRAKSSVNSTKHFYRFPKNPIRKTEWINALGLDQTNFINSTDNYVCEDHFLKHHKGVRQLTRSAIPVLNVTKETELSDNRDSNKTINIESGDNKNFETKTQSPTSTLYTQNIFPDTIISSMESINTISIKNQSVEPTSFSGLFNNCELKIEQTELPSQNDSQIEEGLTKVIIAENLECCSTESLACGTEQNVTFNNFTYKNPVFLQMRIDTYEAELKKLTDEYEELEKKMLDRKAKAKSIRDQPKTNKKLKQMLEFNHVYDKPQMKIPKLIFERFMTDNDIEECPDDLKRFAAEVHSRSPEAYDYLRERLVNVLPPPDDLQQLLDEEVEKTNLTDDDE